MIEGLWCDPDVQQEGWIVTLGGMTINFLPSSRRQAVAEFLLLDSGTQLHTCPVEYPGQRIPFFDPGIHKASGARLRHDGGRLVRLKLPE